MPVSAARTEAQAAASRQNGALSTGPTSAEGKAKSAQNAVRHGICSAKLTFDDPDIEREFNELQAALEDDYRPADEVERAVVKKLAIATWREQVCLNMEIALIQAIDRGEACAMQGGLGLPSLNTLMRYRGRIERDIKAARSELLVLRETRQPAPETSPPTAESVPMDQALKQFSMNEPEPANLAEPTVGMNREQRRRFEAMTRKKS